MFGFIWNSIHIHDCEDAEKEKMIDFIKSMLSSKGDVSSKRIIALFLVMNLVVTMYIAVYNNEEKVAPEFMFDGLCLLAGGGIGLNVLEKIFKKKTDEQQS